MFGCMLDFPPFCYVDKTTFDFFMVHTWHLPPLALTNAPLFYYYYWFLLRAHMSALLAVPWISILFVNELSVLR